MGAASKSRRLDEPDSTGPDGVGQPIVIVGPARRERGSGR